MEFTLSNPGLYFKLFYVSAFVFVFIMVIVHSLKHGCKLRSVLLMLTTLSVFTIIGSRLFTIPISEWLSVVNSESTIQYGDRSAIGALLFGIIGLLFCQKVFRFGRTMLDLYAWMVPFAFGIQKIGCFINGCCYGKISDLFWSVKYPQGSQAHYNQWVVNSIDMNVPFSLSVHPVQLYETLGLLIIAYVVWYTKDMWQKQGSALLFSLFLFFSFRFLMEFFRDPASSQFNDSYLLGIRTFQLGILIAGLVFGLLFIWFEKLVKMEILSKPRESGHFNAELLLITTLSVIIYFFNELFSRYELLSIFIKFVPALLLTAYYLFISRSQIKLFLVGSVVFFVPLFIIAQAVQKDSLASSKYKRIDLGGSFGNFFNEVKYDPQTGACGGTSYSNEYYENAYNIGGLGFAQVVSKGNREITYGAIANVGNITSTRLSTGEKKSEFIFGVNPYFKTEGKWFGYGVGAQVGKFKKNKTETIEASDVEDANKDYNISPEIYLRFGRRDILDIDYRYGFLFPSPFPTAYSRVSLGSGFGRKKDYNLRYGIIYPIESSFISAEGMINEKFGLNFTYIFKEKNDFIDPNLDLGASGKFLFGIQYRFDHKSN